MSKDMIRVVELSDKLKALSHPHRLSIVYGLLNPHNKCDGHTAAVRHTPAQRVGSPCQA